MAEGGGQALKHAINVARSRAGITSNVQLGLRSGVHYDTLLNWFSGRTQPRPKELAKVAAALGMSVIDLQAAYDGLEPELPPLESVIREQTVAIRDLVAELRSYAGEQRSVAEATHELLADLTASLAGARTPGEDES